MATAPETPTTLFSLERLKTLYREARDNTDTARKHEEVAFDYFDDEQLSSNQKKVLRQRKQPEIWVNRIKPAIKGILGVLEQGQSDPRAYPRNQEDQDASEVATDSLRYAADKCRWQRTKLAVAKNYLLGVAGAVIVEVDEEGDPWPRIIRQGEFIYDPHSRDPDFEDARYLGIAKWMYLDIAKEMWPKANITADISPINLNFDDEDKPQHVWSDQKRNRILVVELYINQMGWKKVCFYGGGILSEGPSPYVDEKGTPTNPIVAQSCNIARDNTRYGMAKTFIPIQDEINMSRSRALHLLNSRRVKISDPMALTTDSDIIRTEAARPDGVLPYGVDVADNGDLSQGQWLRMQEAKSELERMGPNPAVLGRATQDASGRAQLVRQQAGLTELTPDLGGIEDIELRVYRQMWARIKQFWTGPKTVRVTDDIGAAKFLMVNEPVVQEVPAIVPGPNGEPMIGTQQVVAEIRNRPAEMDMDIIIDAVADTATVAQEQFSELLKFAQAYPEDVTFDDLLEVSSLPKKRELIEKRQARKQEAAQGAGPQQQMAQAAFTAEMEAKQAKTALDGAKAQGQEIENQANAFALGAQLGMAG